MNWLKLIGRRHSIRQFHPQARDIDLAGVRVACQQIETLNDHPLQLKLVPGSQVQPVLKGFAWRYGRVLAPWYIVAITDDHPLSWLNLGYTVEKIVLELTAMDLGTCWLGGFFNRRRLAENLGLDKEARIPALVAWGQPSSQTWNRLIKTAAGLGRRKQLKDIIRCEIDLDAGPVSWRPLLEAVRWAPSALNRQPWRLWLSLQAIHVYSAGGKSAKGLLPVDMGIALCHLALACRQLAVPGRLETCEHPSRRGWHYWHSYGFKY